MVDDPKKFYPEMYEKETSNFDYYGSKGMEGLEPHDLRQPPYEGNQLTQIDVVHGKDVPNFLREKFESALKFGKLPEVFRHYVGELKKDAKEGKYGAAFDSKTIRVFENYVNEMDKAITLKDQQEAFEPIREYLSRIRMTKREG